MTRYIGFLMSLALFPASTVYASSSEGCDERTGGTSVTMGDNGSPMFNKQGKIVGIVTSGTDFLREELKACSETVAEQQQQIDDLQKEIDDLKSVIVVCICERKNNGLIIDRLVRGEGMSERGAHGQALARCEQVVGSNPHSCINEKTGKPIILIKLPKAG